MGKTIAEKILAKACGREVIPGEIVYCIRRYLGNEVPGAAWDYQVS